MITIKAHFCDDIRRFSVEEDIDFRKLQSLLKDIFELENICIKYYDNDADLITLSSDIDLKEAKLFLKKSQILRLFIFPSEKTNAYHSETKTVSSNKVNDKTLDDILNVDILKDISSVIPQEKDLLPNDSQLKVIPQDKLVDICCKLSEAISLQSFSSSNEILDSCLKISRQIVKETENAALQTLDMCKGLNRDYSSLSDEIKNQCNDLSNTTRTLCLNSSEEIANLIRNI